MIASLTVAFGGGETRMEKRFGVVSADGHCRLMHLPFDLWTKRLPRKFQDDGPRVVKGPDGTRPYQAEAARSGVRVETRTSWEAFPGSTLDAAANNK